MTQMQRQRRGPRKRRSRWYGGGRRGWPLVKYGMIWFGIGLVITIGTYAFAVSRGGGTYLVSYGPMVVGAVCMARGGFDVLRQRRAAGSAPRPADGQSMATAPGYGGGYNGYSGYDGHGTRWEQAEGSRENGAWDGYQGGGRQARAGYSQAERAGYSQAERAGYSQAERAGYSQAERAAYAQTGQANTTAPQPNWYPDPQHPAMLRWWDGQMWTNHTRPAG